MTIAELLRLIDELDELVHQAKTVPFTGDVRVNKEAVYDLLDLMRAALPDPRDVR